PEPYVFKIHFGQPDDQPVPGRYSGKSFRQLAIFRPGNGLWVVRNFTRIYFGREGDRATPADYNGDGTTDFSIYRPEENFWAVRNITRANFPKIGENIPIPADFQGDGSAEMALFNKGLGRWMIHSYSSIYFGEEEDLPVSGPGIKRDFGGKGKEAGRLSELLSQ
ncbi:unnamed protein product, partial [marine sediment metagenome]